MVRAPRDVFNRMVWDPFIDLHGVMEDHFETAMEQLIRKAVHGDTADAGSSS